MAADERDVTALRTNHRGEDVYLSLLRTPVALARNLLLDYARELNELSARPRWYNALVHNCTTAIRYHLHHVTPTGRWSWKLLANGHLDELIYARGNFDTDLPFAEFRRRSAISARARAAGDAPDFSARIREGLPEPAR